MKKREIPGPAGGGLLHTGTFDAMPGGSAAPGHQGAHPLSAAFPRHIQFPAQRSGRNAASTRLEQFLRTRVILDFNAEKAGGRQLLWVPPTHPYYELRADSPFAKFADFTKLLFFFGYTLVPRALAAAFSPTQTSATI